MVAGAVPARLLSSCTPPLSLPAPNCLVRPLSSAFPPTDLWKDDLIGRVTLPLRALDLTPGAMNDLWLEVPRSGAKPGYGEFAAAPGASEPRVLAERRPSSATAAGGVEASAAPGGVARREDSAARLQSGGGSPSWLGLRLPGSASPRASPPPPAGAVEPAGPDSPRGRRASPQLGAPGLARASPAMRQLRQLVVSPLEVLRSRRCMLHIQATYLPLVSSWIWFWAVWRSCLGLPFSAQLER